MLDGFEEWAGQNAPTTDAAVFAAQQMLGALPADYLAFMRELNGGEGEVGSMFVRLWSIEELVERNEGYGISELAPGLIAIGSDGGGEAFGFDTRQARPSVVMVPFISSGWDESIELSATFEDFMIQIARGFVPGVSGWERDDEPYVLSWQSLHQTVVTIADVDALLDRLHDEFRAQEPTLVTIVRPEGENLSIALGLAISALTYTAADGKPPRFVALGAADTGKSFVVREREGLREFAAKNAIPITTARVAAREFCETGARSPKLAWEAVQRFRCLCCGFRTLAEEPPGTYDICPVCFWEDDPVQSAEPRYRGGANEESLEEARANFERIGASEARVLHLVRPPLPEERD